MRLFLALSLVSAVALAGCGGGSRSPESVVRAWSSALNAGDNEGAADLFARNAEVVQGADVFRLRTHQEAVAFNASLPCSGRIVAISIDGEEATAEFVLGDRETSRCDGPGQRAGAVFHVHHGKIVLWHQTGVAAAPGAPVI